MTKFFKTSVCLLVLTVTINMIIMFLLGETIDWSQVSAPSAVVSFALAVLVYDLGSFAYEGRFD